MVAACALAPGDVVEIDGAGFAVAGAMTIGHKLARRALAPGEKVIKYGANIGHAMAAIPPGAHIYTHNLTSDAGGTRKTIAQGRDWVAWAQEQLASVAPVPMRVEELFVGTVCGGSDGTSGITANPAMGLAFDQLVVAGAACIFEGTGELIGCEFHMQRRAATPVVGSAISPVIKVCANPEIFRRLEDDMDIDAGRMEGRGTLDEVRSEVLGPVLDCAKGGLTKSEAMGHQEFILTYKSFETPALPARPACFPLQRN